MCFHVYIYSILDIYMYMYCIISTLTYLDKRVDVCTCTGTYNVHILSIQLGHTCGKYHTRKEENCTWILFVDFICALCAGSGLPHNKYLHTCIFVHKNTQKHKKIHVTSIVGVSSIKTYNKTTAQFSCFTVT